MPTIYMMCGLPASGKSTHAKKLENTAVLLSSDSLREELYGNRDDQDHNDEVFQELHRRIKSSLIAGPDVVYDACNISYKRRRTFLESLNKINCQKVCILMATPYEDCIEHNHNRENNVPDYIIKRMYLNFYIPMYQEGWNEIKIEWNYNPNNFDLNQLFNGENGLNKIDQNNPHHTLTIGQHCLLCSGKIGTYDSALGEAALLHDIGKQFTKQFKNAKGEDTKEAHYYGHMNVGAYDSLFYTQGWTDINRLLISAYIQFHMQPFFLITKKSKDKFANFVGQSFWDNLMILHEADLLAH